MAELEPGLYRDQLLEIPRIVRHLAAPFLTPEKLEILDFGCGHGNSALAFALSPEVERVVGIDILPKFNSCRARAQGHLRLGDLPPKLRFERVEPGRLHDDHDRFDLIYSWSVFEHIRQDLLPGTVAMLRRALKPGGILVVQIAPLFFSSEGSHYFAEIGERWGHLTDQADLFREKLRAAVKGSEAEVQEALTIYDTLNRITAPGLVGLLEEGGFEILLDHRVQEDHEIPGPLLDIYREDVLRLHGIGLVARATSGYG